MSGASHDAARHDGTDGTAAELATLLERLPHAEPFRFVSGVTRVVRPTPAEPDEPLSIEGVWRVRGDEWFLRGHFPTAPLVPGVLIMEALAQLAGVLMHLDHDVGASTGDQGQGRLALVEGRFLREVVPPVELRLVARLGSLLERLGMFEVEARVGESVVARGRVALHAGGGAASP